MEPTRVEGAETAGDSSSGCGDGCKPRIQLYLRARHVARGSVLGCVQCGVWRARTYHARSNKTVGPPRQPMERIHSGRLSLSLSQLSHVTTSTARHDRTACPLLLPQRLPEVGGTSRPSGSARTGTGGAEGTNALAARCSQEGMQRSPKNARKHMIMLIVV